MTQDEFLAHWQEYKLILPNGKEIILKEMFFVCFKMNGGLLCDTGGPQGAPAYLLKTDEHNNCFIKTDWSASDGEAWELCGKLEKL